MQASMEKKVMMNTRLSVAAVVLLFGLLLAGQEAAAAGYDDAAPATEATPATEAASAPATEAAEATTPTTASGSKARASYGKANKADCEVPGTCDVKVAAADSSTRPGAPANTYTRGCSKITGCRG